MAQADRSNFEQEWENAFADARMKPSPKVWDGIERSLHGGHSKRKGIFLLQLAMAASVLFAMSIGAAGVYQEFFAGKEQKIAMNPQPEELPAAGDEKAAGTSDSADRVSPTDALDYPSKPVPGNDFSKESPSDQKTDLESSFGQDALPDNIVSQNQLNRTEQQTTPLLVEESVHSSFDEDLDRLDPFSSSLAYNATLLRTTPQAVPYSIVTYRNDQVDRAGWASLGFAAGNYNAGSAPQNSYLLGASMDYNNVSVGSISEEASGSVFQVEMNIGKKFAAKWFIQGGLGYMERNSAGRSNLVSAQSNSVATAFTENRQVVVSEPYEIENSMQIVTLPVQVGYILLDKKVGLKVLTGITNELMVKYQIQDAAGHLSSQSIRASDSEDYNGYGMSALVTTEISYALADRYQLAVYPQVRKSIMPLKETDSELPMSMELGVRFRYMIE